MIPAQSPQNEIHNGGGRAMRMMISVENNGESADKNIDLGSTHKAGGLIMGRRQSSSNLKEESKIEVDTPNDKNKDSVKRQLILPEIAPSSNISKQ